MCVALSALLPGSPHNEVKGTFYSVTLARCVLEGENEIHKLISGGCPPVKANGMTLPQGI